MFKYLDQDFFKFLLGFVAILSVSMMIILVTRAYQQNKMENSQANLVSKNISP